MSIKVVDALMGSGKTNDIIDEINSDNKTRYLVVTILLSEIKRIKASCSSVYSPNNGFKLDELKRLIKQNKSICITHELFKNINEEIISLLKEREYHLIIDETINCIKHLDISKFDLLWLFKSGILKDDGVVSWGYPEIDKSSVLPLEIKALKSYADNNMLHCNNDRLFWVLNPLLFSCFKETKILTYRFESSLMCVYFKLYNIQYEVEERSSHIVSNDIVIYEGKHNDALKDYRLTHNFYTRLTKEQAIIINNTCTNVIRGFGFGVRDTMWTAPKCAVNLIVGVDNDGRKLPGRKSKYLNILDHRSVPSEKFIPTFLYSNARATNVYAYKTMALYLINRYINPNIYNFFLDKNAIVDQDDFAINELTQWLWRGAIRNNKHITLFLPSKRMRLLLRNFLNGGC